jgi:hypothetical protein
VLADEGEADLTRLSDILRTEFPYITALQRTWETYARVLANWFDLSDLAVWDASTSRLLKHEAGTQVRERSLSFARRRSGIMVPVVHFSPVVQVATRLVSAAQQDSPVDWSGISRSTVYKALSVLEEMALISRKAQVIYVRPDCHAFVGDPDRRIDIARQAVSKWPVFCDFVSILSENSSRRMSHKKLAEELVARSDAGWKSSTAETNAKIMLDWARHLGLAVGRHAHSIRGQFKRSSDEERMPLFEHLDESSS